MEAAPAKKKKPTAPARRNPAASFTDDILVEILRRLPVRSVCRFKCVSRSWRRLISDPVHRKKLPQTLAGFFYDSWNYERFPPLARHFTNITGKGLPLIHPSFSFLPVPSGNVTLLDSCNGLIFCRCFEPVPHEGDGYSEFHYVVCNPATEEWVMLPNGSAPSVHEPTVCLGFDPAVSSHFHVVEYVLDEEECVTGVEIYSSKTDAWSFKESEWGNGVILYDVDGMRGLLGRRSVSLNGFTHMLQIFGGVVAVDMELKTWRTIPVPSDCYYTGCIHQSQGRLCLLNVDDTDFCKLKIWILEDRSSHEWTLKHSVRIHFLFGENNPWIDYRVIAFHPECNLVYFVYGRDNTLIAYEMDRKEVRVIRNLGYECSNSRCYLPYVPWFAEGLADGQ